MSSRLGLPLAFAAAFSVTALPSQRPTEVPPPSPRTALLALPDAEFDAACMAASVPWQEFVAANGADWLSQWHPATRTPRTVLGTGLPLPDWRGDSEGEARRQAEKLLQQHSELLGLGTSEFREAIAAPIGRMWSFVFDQYFRGLPVLGGRADVRVHRTGKVSMFGSVAVPIDAGFVTVPTIDELNAARIAWLELGLPPSDATQPADTRRQRLVIWADLTSPVLAQPFLAWEVPVANVDAEGNGPIGRYLVDARTGAVLSYQNDKHQCGTPGCTLRARGFRPGGNGPEPLPLATGTVRGWTRTGLSATAPLANVPLPGVELSIPGVGTVVTDANGAFTANVAAPVAVTARLDGVHNAPILGASAPTVTFTLDPVAPANVQFLTSAATVAQAAHTTTYWWVHRVNEFCRSILGNTAQLATADLIVPTVNIASTCNAYYTANTINFYSAGGGCNNTSFSTVVAHEWGHGLDDRYGGISQTNGLSEGWGDIVAMYLVDNPVVGDGFFTTGAAIRTGLNTRQYPTGASVHDQGESWMGFAWHLREGLTTSLGSRAAAIALTNRIVLGTMPANALNQQDAVTQVFLADDDDANVRNGTPHSTQLLAACALHALPDPILGPVPPATATAYGVGCYRATRSFYERFLTAGVFDLTTRSLRMTLNGGRYTVGQGGVYVAPGATSTNLLLGDDTEATVSLGGTFSYPGGSTTSLVVCSNGYVSAGPGNPLLFDPAPITWLSGTYARWGMVHDFDPGSGGSVRFHKAGTIAYVTWLSVRDFGSATTNTWQMQFDLATGTVTVVWPQISRIGNGYLVGFSSGGKLDPGPTDLSVASVAGFSTGTADSNGLALASTLPRRNTTVVLTTTGYPVGATPGVTMLGPVQINPGLDLAAQGMPGCSQYVGFDVSVFQIPAGGSSTLSMLIPSDPALIGYAIHAQSFALAPGANTRGAISSNGVRLVIGS